MRGFQLILGQDDPAAAAGAMAGATLDRPDGGGHLLRKGQRIGPAEVEGLRALAATAPGTRVSLLALDADDVDETTAAQMLSAAFAGPGVTLRGPSQGRVRLSAARTGLVRVAGARLAAANTLPDISVYTVFDGTPVAAGAPLGEVKITPLAAPRAVIEEAVRALAPDDGAPVLEVRAFTPHRAALVVCERLAPDAAGRMVRGLQNKLAWFGSTLDAGDVDHVANDRAEVASRLHAAMDRGATHPGGGRLDQRPGGPHALRAGGRGRDPAAARRADPPRQPAVGGATRRGADHGCAVVRGLRRANLARRDAAAPAGAGHRRAGGAGAAGRRRPAHAGHGPPLPALRRAGVARSPGAASHRRKNHSIARHSEMVFGHPTETRCPSAPERQASQRAAWICRTRS